MTRSKRLPQNREHDDDSRESGHHEQNGGQDREQGHERQELQRHAVLLTTLSTRDTHQGHPLRQSRLSKPNTQGHDHKAQEHLQREPHETQVFTVLETLGGTGLTRLTPSLNEGLDRLAKGLAKHAGVSSRDEGLRASRCSALRGLIANQRLKRLSL